MKRLTISITLSVIAFSMIAQQNLAVKYSVSNRDSDKEDIVKSEMILITNPSSSLYYNKMSLYVDSCMSTPEGAAQLKEIQDKGMRVEHPDGTVTMDGWKYRSIPMKTIYMYVDKDLSKNRITTYDRKAGELKYYEEPTSEINWMIIEDSTKNIQGFECIMAKTDYHGRNWTVWFTPEIPIQDGPWKLHGLPGIILEADGGNDFYIITSEIGETAQDIPNVYSTNLYQKGDRKKILKDHEHYINNLLSIISAQGIKLNDDGSNVYLPKFNRQNRAWETDY